MWCIVNIPNGTQLAVKWDSKAIGQECLEKVCKALDIICEMEYFGLEYWTPTQDETRTRQWINLRNRLSYDNSSGIQLMLALHVKFWIPVHFLLQESVRNIFYMQAKSDLLEGRLKVHNWTNAAKLSALLCQADGMRFNELSLKSKIPVFAKDDHSLHKPAEQDKHKDRKDKEYVLSFKKRRLSKQRSYENIENFHPAFHHTTGALTFPVSGPETSANIMKTKSHVGTISYLAHQASSGMKLTSEQDCEFTENGLTASPLSVYQDYLMHPADDVIENIPDDFLRQIAIEHGKLSRLKMTQKSAKYWLLQQIQELPGYGEEVFSGVTASENSVRCDVAVGTHSITACVGDEKNTIPFSAVTAAKSFRRTLKLEYVGDYNERKELEIKFPKHAIAAGLYRSITERHAFYVCDKVRGVVTSQFTRDLKGTIASMFKEDTELGKRYVFDIQHTCREVHDQARRILHERGIEISTYSISSSSYDELMHSSSGVHDFSGNKINSALQNELCFGKGDSIADKFDEALRVREDCEAAIAQSVETRVSEAMTCKICMDREINTMFNPCCHVTVCTQCAARCVHCPICRVKITSTVKVYLPPELRKCVK